MTAGGVPAGARMPHHVVTSKPGTPASAIVGMSGNSGDRFAPVTASTGTLLVFHVLQDGRHRGKEQVDAAGEQVDRRRPAALVRHVRHRQAGLLPEHLARQVVDAALAGRAVVQALGPRLAGGDCLREGAWRRAPARPPPAAGRGRSWRPARSPWPGRRAGAVRPPRWWRRSRWRTAACSRRASPWPRSRRPSAPPAPPRFSTTTGLPSFSAMALPRSRAMLSVPPPGANGTTSVMGRVGKSCAAAGPDGPSRPAATPTTASVAKVVVRLLRCIRCLLTARIMARAGNEVN